MSSFDFATFFAHPSSSSVLPAAPAPISAEHQEKLDELIKWYGADDYVLPGDPASGVEGGPLSDWEKTFLSREGLLRFLRADRFDIPTAIKRIDKCLTWRRKTGVDDLEGLADRVEGEHRAKGGQFLFGYDKTGRPVIFMQPSRRDEPPTELGLIHLFWTLERSIDLMPPHVEKTAFLIDFSGKRKHSTPIGLAKEWVTVLQSCYPERLGLGIIANAPYLLSTFLSLVLRFCDPLTQSKIIVTSSGSTSSSLISSTIAPDQLQTPYGGEKDLGVWDEGVHEAYWRAVKEVCAERRKERLRCWNEVSGGVGVSEEIWKGRSGGE